MMNFPYITRCGLPGFEHIPVGMHACYFYRNRNDLVAATVPSSSRDCARTSAACGSLHRCFRRTKLFRRYAPRRMGQMSDVLHVHHCAFERPDSNWQMIPPHSFLREQIERMKR
jgi:hypothetical protein